MEHLATHDIRRLFEFLRDLYLLRDHNVFKQALVKGIADLVSADLYAYNEISTTKKIVTGYAFWPESFPLGDGPAIIGQYQHQHPAVVHFLSTGKGDVTKISDFMTYRQFRRTDLYNEYYRPKGIPYGIAFGISLAQDGLIGIGLHRSGRDYSERDRRVLSELHPHIVQAFENAQAVTRMQHGTTAIHGVLDALDSAVVCLSPNSTIRWATPRAERILLEYQLVGHRTRDRLPRRITDWLQAQESELSCPSGLPNALSPLVVSGPGGTVTIRLMRQGQTRLLMLEEARPLVSQTALGHLGLSPRETVILGWVAQGKTNPEIGIILGISPRTVQKHLEHIYSHLGIENRHAAMRMALDAIRQRQPTNGGL
ncbi:MAG: helix-turn-helix transcriptional regulator [Nitrospira sp.]|nr:helix-turn-helix transcriptional regulator [Nitrospira sp.]